jgi:hypothetical protein
MVTFECTTCIQVLKKKQIENHYKFQCKSANSFCCLTCYKMFDRQTIIAHTSCITEQEKYKMNDNKKIIPSHNLIVQKVDLDKLKWSGFRKTTKKILLGQEGHKLPMKDVYDKLSHVYAHNKQVSKEEICLDKLRKAVMLKIEDDNKFVIDLGKNTIRYKA